MIKKTVIFAGYIFLTVVSICLTSSPVLAGCERGDCKQGPGIYVWPDGAKYNGNFLNGKFHGQGTYSWPGGKQYVGEFKSDKRNGLGTYTWPNGASYTGEWESGKKSGYGIYTFPNGNKNIGLWKNGKLSQEMEESEIKGLLAAGRKQPLPAEATLARTQSLVTTPVAAVGGQNADADLEKQLAALGGPLEETEPAAGDESLPVTEAAASAVKTIAGTPFLISVKNLLLIDGRKFNRWENIPLFAVGPISPVGTCSVEIDEKGSDEAAGKLMIKLKIENSSNCALDFKGFIQTGAYYVKVVSWSGDQAIAPQSRKETLQTILLDENAPRSKIVFKLQGRGADCEEL